MMAGPKTARNGNLLAAASAAVGKAAKLGKFAVCKFSPRCIFAASAKVFWPTVGEITPSPCGLKELLKDAF